MNDAVTFARRVGRAFGFDIIETEDRKERFVVVPGGKWLVWSNEHKMWWRPGWCGYTEKRSEAGRYSFTEAARICKGANEWIRDDEREPNETMVQDY